MQSKSFITLLFISVSVFSYGQDHLDYVRYMTIFSPNSYVQFPVAKENKHLYVKEHGIEKVRIQKTKFTQKGKEKRSSHATVYHYDSAGLISMTQHYKKDKLGESELYTYNGYSTRTPSSKVGLDKKGNIRYSEFWSMKDSSIEQEYVKLNNKGDTIFQRKVNDIIDLRSKDYYYKKGKLLLTWDNEYYENKSIKRTRLLKANGKEKYVWDYQCKEEGVEVKKHKDTTTRCDIIEEDKNGVTTYIYHTVNEKGEVFKTINKKNKAGKYFYYKRTKGPEDEVVYEQMTTYGEDGETRLASSHTNYRKGYIYHTYSYSYDKKGNETQKLFKKYKKDKLIVDSVTKYTYDERSRPIMRTSSDSINGGKNVVEFSYDI